MCSFRRCLHNGKEQSIEAAKHTNDKNVKNKDCPLDRMSAPFRMTLQAKTMPRKIRITLV